MQVEAGEDATSALQVFDPESSLLQAALRLAARVTTGEAIADKKTDFYSSKVEEDAAETPGG